MIKRKHKQAKSARANLIRVFYPCAFCLLMLFRPLSVEKIHILRIEKSDKFDVSQRTGGQAMCFKRGGWKWVALVVTLLQLALLGGWFKEYFPKVFVYNYSASLPRGWYLVLPTREYKVGDIVAFTLPDSAGIAYERQWMRKGDYMLKKIGALEGNRFSVSDTEFRIEGHYVGPVFDKDHEGLPMPRVRGRFVVRKGHFLAVSSAYVNSFDGRYFADISVENIRHKVVPFLTE